MAVCAWASEEIREERDGAGKLVGVLALKDGRVVKETHYTYEGAALVRTESKEDTGTTVESWSIDGGKTLAHEITIDGLRMLSETFLYEGNKLVSKTVSDDSGVTELVTYTYDSTDRLVETVVKGPDGALRSRIQADWQRPEIPVTFSLAGNTNWATLADTFGAGGGLSVSRKPDPSQYEIDPLEFIVAATYTYARAQGVITTSDLRASSSLDFNEILPRTTLFLFTTVAHNPVANLNIEVFIAPIGIKYGLVRAEPWSLDASFAPLWNYRSIDGVVGSVCGETTLSADGECSTSRVRGSLRMRGGYEDERVSLKDKVEFLPDLDPSSFVPNLDTDSIFRNTLTLEMKLSSSVSLTESFVATRDRTLASQFDCAGGDNNPACDGVSLENAATLTVSFAVGQ